MNELKAKSTTEKNGGCPITSNCNDFGRYVVTYAVCR